MVVPLTISYSDDVQGWTSFWSYIPDYMVYVSNNFYTFKNGNIYLHNFAATQRTVYYASSPYVNLPICEVRTVFNDSPLEVKLFKTLSLESTSAWSVSVTTDLISGNINNTWFEEKEGSYFAHIRRNNNPSGGSLINIGQLDDKLSTRIIGLGNVLNSGGAPVPYFRINSYPSSSLQIKDVSAPDDVYKYFPSGVLSWVGTVQSVDNFDPNGQPIVYLSTVGTLPNSGDEILAIKNSVAESYGARGYYMDVTLTYNSATTVELFEIGASVFKSFM